MVQLAEELETARTTYGALHSQLVDELPTLLQLSTEVCNRASSSSSPPFSSSRSCLFSSTSQVYNQAVNQFVLARKMFVGRITKELLQLMDVS